MTRRLTEISELLCLSSTMGYYPCRLGKVLLVFPRIRLRRRRSVVSVDKCDERETLVDAGNTEKKNNQQGSHFTPHMLLPHSSTERIQPTEMVGSRCRSSAVLPRLPTDAGSRPTGICTSDHGAWTMHSFALHIGLASPRTIALG